MTLTREDRVIPCAKCNETGRVWANDRDDQYGDNTRDCPECGGTGAIGIANPFALLSAWSYGPVADSLAHEVDAGRWYALECWLRIAATTKHRLAFGPFLRADGSLDRLELLREMARAWVKLGEDCARIDARKKVANG